MDEKSSFVTGVEDSDLREIRSNMDETKKDLASTLDELRGRYSSDRIAQSARERAEDLEEKASEMVQKRTEDLKRAAERVGETIRSHPIPFAAAGAAGLGISAWALLRRQSGEEPRPGEYPAYEEQRAVAGYYGEEFQDSNLEFTCEQGEGVDTGRAGRMASRIGDKARSFGQSAMGSSERLRTNFVEVVREHPFISGTATFLLGILSGLIFPSTRPEDQVLGGAREKVRRKAYEIKEEAIESAQRVAEEAKRTAAEEAEKHGLTPG